MRLPFANLEIKVMLAITGSGALYICLRAFESYARKICEEVAPTQSR